MLRTTLLHDGWEFAEESWLDGTQPTYGFKPGWLPAEVPGHVHLDLVRNGVIGDPFVSMQEWGCQWVDEKDWRYRTSFEWQPDDALPRRVLRFEGLDTVCTLWLNGEQIAAHDNMFLPLEIDVSERLQPGTNQLEVRFQSAQRVGRERRAAYLKANSLPDDVANFDERAFVRKAQYMFGWDWGPRLVSCGIWKKVELIEYIARITDTWVRAEPYAEGRYRLRVTTEVEGTGDVAVELSFTERRTEIAGSFDVFEERGADVSFDLGSDALVWGPRGGLGYRIEVSLVDGDVLDRRELRYGVSSTELRREPDEFGESFEVQHNGERLWIRGANCIPDHSFPASVDRERLRAKLSACRWAGFNMLRVWGGGLYESDDFYDLCDELGILVWQDFPHACSYYPDDEAAQEVVRAEAIANIKRLRNHPCLALWCGNNENQTMWEGAWGGKYKQPDREHGERLYHQVLPDVLAEYDPGRAYIPTSPIGTDPKHPELGCNAGGFGDSHFWDAWHGRGDWTHYSDSTARFSSEFGFASAPSLAAWQQAGISADTPLDAPELRWHDKTKKGWDTYIGFIKLHYPEPTNLEELIYYSQLNQRDAMRHAIEHYRRSEFCKGTLIWQLNDCWPVQSWSLIDSAGVPKAAFHELKRLYADELVAITLGDGGAEVHVANDGPFSFQSDVWVEAASLSTGEVVRRSEAAPVSLEPGERRHALTLDLAGLQAEDTAVVARFGEFVPPAWRLLCEPKDALLQVPKLSITIEKDVLWIRGDCPVVDLRFGWIPEAEWITVLAKDWQVPVPTGRLSQEFHARSLAGPHLIPFEL